MVEVIVTVDTRATSIEVEGSIDADGKITFLPGGFELVESFTKYIREAYGLLIGRLASERIIFLVCTTMEETPRTIHGRFLADGEPKTIQITRKEAERAISNVIDQIVRSVTFHLLEDVSRLHQGMLLAKQITLKGEFKNLIDLRNQLEKSLNRPIIVDKPRG